MSNLKPYCGVKNKIPKGYKRGSQEECIIRGQTRYYGRQTIDTDPFSLGRERIHFEGLKYKS